MTELTNDTATPYWSNQNTVCQRSGKKVKPGQGVIDAYGLFCHPDYADKLQPLDRIASKPERKTGSPRPEQTDKFGTYTAADLP